MKTILSILFILSSSLLLRAQSVADVSDNSAIQITTPDRGTLNAGDIKSVLANYPGLSTALKVAIKAKFDADDDLSAARRWKDLQTRGITLPAAAVTAINNRIAAIRAQRETALRNVVQTDPARAKAKMDELIAAGVPITQATQDIVNAAQPTPAPTATPAPTPNDGL